MRLFTLILLAVSAQICQAACPVPPTSKPNDISNKLAISKLSQLLVCSADDPINDQSPCNTFAARGLDSIYSVNDFNNQGKFLSANQIWDYVSKSDQWGDVGDLFNEGNNYCAQALANQAYPVVAVMKASGHGHIAVVIPGEVSKSGSWNMKVANSASFLLGHPERAYVGGPLSKAFGAENAKKAHIFYRKASWHP